MSERKQYCKTIKEAICKGELYELQRLVQQGLADVNEVDNKSGFSPLHWAAHYGSLECLHWLLWHGANTGKETKQGWSAAHIAAIRGRDSCIVALAANNVDLNRQDKRGKTPCHLASSHGNTSTLQEILRKGGDVSKTDNMCWNIAHTAAYHGRLGCLQLAKKWNCDFHLLDDNGNTVVHLASSQGNLQCLKYLVSTLPNIRTVLKTRNDHGETAKDLAEQTLNDESYVYLDQVEFDLDHPEQTENISYPAHNSAYKGDLDYLKTVIETGMASINDQDTNGSTPAHKAAGNGQVNILKWLIEKGANLEVLNCVYETPKDVAIRFGQLACIKLLGGDADSIIELENDECNVIITPPNFNEVDAKARAEGILQSLYKQLEIAKTNFKQLGGVLKDDQNFVKRQKEHARVVASLNKQLEFERVKREKLEAQLDNLRIQVHNLTIQLEDAQEQLAVRESIIKEPFQTNRHQTNNTKKKTKRKKLRPGIFLINSPNLNDGQLTKKPTPPHRPKSAGSSSNRPISAAHSMKSKTSAGTRSQSSLSKCSTVKSLQQNGSLQDGNISLQSSMSSIAKIHSSPSSEDSLSDYEDDGEYLSDASTGASN